MNGLKFQGFQWNSPAYIKCLFELCRNTTENCLEPSDFGPGHVTQVKPSIGALFGCKTLKPNGRIPGSKKIPDKIPDLFRRRIEIYPRCFISKIFVHHLGSESTCFFKTLVWVRLKKIELLFFEGEKLH